MTRNVSEHYRPEELLTLNQCFQHLSHTFRDEYHFIIGFASKNEGEGENVWYIIDENEEERIETMLFPQDY